MDLIKINELQIENVKRVKAVRLEPDENGLTIIGGKNRQGKTSVLDSIAWALGGDKFRPSMPQREDANTAPMLRITMNNGLIVERKGKNSDLKVTDPSGRKAGQQLLNTFIEQLALDLPHFLQSSNKEKATILLQIIGVGAELKKLEQDEQDAYQERLYLGRTAEQKKSYAAELPSYPDAPAELVSAFDLMQKRQDILNQNLENQKKRHLVSELEKQACDLNEQLRVLLEKQQAVIEKLNAAKAEANKLKDQTTEEIDKKIKEVDEINRKVQANAEKKKAKEESKKLEEQYQGLTERITKIRNSKVELLNSADLPLPELSVVNGELVYKGQCWDNMSGADRLIVSTAIVRRLNPKCGFVLIDKLEQMDMDTLKEFGNWLQREGLQAIATRVSVGDECSIIIEDGCVAGNEAN